MKKVLFALILAMLTLGTACRKYEEGPLVSFRSRTSRVVNDWTVKSVYINAKLEAAHTAIGTQYTFTKDGRFSVNTDSTGSWRFLSNDEILYLEYDDKVTKKKYTIKKLKEDALWVYYYDSLNYKIELRME
ncbi:MAG TPA: hypothetical protein VL947_00050 [Cytophagales bacterium]|nr:hypothetical protein [Cytophagales bacterium]